MCSSTSGWAYDLQLTGSASLKCSLSSVSNATPPLAHSVEGICNHSPENRERGDFFVCSVSAQGVVH